MRSATQRRSSPLNCPRSRSRRSGSSSYCFCCSTPGDLIACGTGSRTTSGSGHSVTEEVSAMTSHIKTIGAILLAFAACKKPSDSSGAAVADKGAATETKPASDEIVLGILADLTGPTADVGKPYDKGMMSYIDNLNAQGGIKGKKIKPMS